MHRHIGVVLIGLTIGVLTGRPVAAAEPGALPQYIASLTSGHLLNAPAVRGAVLNVNALGSFLSLTSASRNEVCRLLLEHYSAAVPGVRKVVIVGGPGATVTSCE